jgi:protein TonB
MSKLSIYETNWIDLVFENRNREYGAYSLRQENTKTSLLALFIGALLLTAAISIPMIYNYLNPEHRITSIVPDIPVVLVDLNTYVLPHEETKIEKNILPETKRPITENINTSEQLINPEIARPDLATPDIATNTELKNTTNPNTVGTANTGTNTSTSTTTTATSTAVIPDNRIVPSPELDKMPEFPGGIKKFYTYVGNNFEKPEIDSENAIRVSISFVIEKDGSMTDIKVLKDPGYGLGAEAIRVLKSLKTKWSPGMFEGKAVRTSYNLPITIQPN